MKDLQSKRCTYCNRDHDAKDCTWPRSTSSGMSPAEAIRLLRLPESTLSQADCNRIAATIGSMQSDLQRLSQLDMFNAKRSAR